MFKKLISSITSLAVLLGTMLVLFAASAGTANATVSQVGSTIRFTGVTTVTLREYDYCGPNFSRRLVTTYTGQLSSTLDIAPRKVTAGGVETNPFHFHFLAGSASVFGSLELDSAQAPLGALHQYWTFGYRSSDGAINGNLTNTQVSSAVAWNLLNGQQQVIPCRNYGAYPMTFAVAQGAAMTGTVTNSRARVTYSGWSKGGEYSFVYQFAG